MIIDKIENILLYKFLPTNIKDCLIFLQDTNFTSMKNGKYDIKDDAIFFIVQRYETKPFSDGKLETHKKYIDIQYLAEGSEILGYDSTENLEIADPYNDQNDITFYKLSKNTSPIVLNEKKFCILFPQAAHMPGKYIDKPSDVLKVVIKIRI